MMHLDYSMSVELPHHHQQIDDCASEIAVYVSNHGNWDRPILPGGDSCPDMEFVPERFDHQGNAWTCKEQNHGNKICVKKCCIFNESVRKKIQMPL